MSTFKQALHNLSKRSAKFKNGWELFLHGSTVTLFKNDPKLKDETAKFATPYDAESEYERILAKFSN